MRVNQKSVTTLTGNGVVKQKMLHRLWLPYTQDFCSAGSELLYVWEVHRETIHVQRTWPHFKRPSGGTSCIMSEGQVH